MTDRPEPFEPALDCRHYLGDRPCTFKQRCRCAHYQPMGTRILIIKLGALGDVVRTACLLPTLKRLYDPCHITWISQPSGVAILKGHPQVDRLARFDAEGILGVQQQPFDLVLSLDKEAGPTALCNAVQSADKRGIGLSAWGTAEPLNDACRSYFLLGLDDELKFRHNTHSYPELVHQALGLPYTREPYRLGCDPADRARARALFASALGAGDAPRVVGLNTGSGRVFANKAPKPQWWVDLGRLLIGQGCRLALLGGPDEDAQNRWIHDQLAPHAMLTGSDNTEGQFVAIVDQCDLVVTGDTLALHVAIGRDVPTVALFGPTCEQEIDVFGRGCKVVSPIDCSPCYLRKCDKSPNCMDMIPPARVAQAVMDALAESTASAGGE